MGHGAIEFALIIVQMLIVGPVGWIGQLWYSTRNNPLPDQRPSSPAVVHSEWHVHSLDTNRRRRCVLGSGLARSIRMDFLRELVHLLHDYLGECGRANEGLPGCRGFSTEAAMSCAKLGLYLFIRNHLRDQPTSPDWGRFLSY